MDVREPRTHQLSSGARVALGAHAVIVCLVGAYICVSAAVGAVGANIGLALGLLCLGLLGAPWSLAILLVERFTVDSAEFIGLAIAGALVNLSLHAFVWAKLGARQRRG